MAAPVNELIQYSYQNPHSSMPMLIPMLVVCNTSEEDIGRNVYQNTAHDLKWIKPVEAHDGIAVMIGGGASVENDIDRIKDLQAGGATVFAMNGASKWANKNGIKVDYQVIADAKAETATLIDPMAQDYLLASQVHEDTTAAAMSVKPPIIWHLETGSIEKSFAPKEKYGVYALIGGGATVGNSSICVAYTLGFRDLEIFGYDSCHQDDRSHAYSQPMNDAIPNVNVEWGGETFKASVAMKAQAEKFQMTSQALKQAGCTLTVHGWGLLQAMYHTDASNMTEREKYQRMWTFDMYREISPGELVAGVFLTVAKPEGMIIDFGCGTGRALLALSEQGHDVLGIDFASNCRDEEAMALPFLEWDLARPIPSRANYGYCTDVMEHIPPEDVETVLANIMESAKSVFFQISTVEDLCGDLIGAPLHLSIYDHDKWAALLSDVGDIEWSENRGGASLFYTHRKS